MIRLVFHGTNNVAVQIMYEVVHFGPHTYFELKESYAQTFYELF
jgi:hypothetical protein